MVLKEFSIGGIIFFSLILGHRSLINAKLTSIVHTDKGPIRGEIVKTVQKSVKYSAFRAIPYAKPPIGQLRFKPPVEPEKWTKVIHVTNEAPSCPQLNRTDSTYLGDESCLYLSVYTPKIKFSGDDGGSNEKLMAVMVWIYGGGFLEGTINSSTYGPDFFIEDQAKIEDNVVIVAMNYRLGALGFLSINHPDATGNQGLKDQVLALKWVQKNIKKFGGDPRRVTIFGQSAGAVSVSLHQISDASKGLFNASIAMSGSVLNYWGFTSRTKAVLRAFELGTKLGVITISKKKLLRKLYAATPEELVRAAYSMLIIDLVFKPTVEDKKIATDVFLSECAVKRLKEGNYQPLPTILGFVQYEALAFNIIPGLSSYNRRSSSFNWALINASSDVAFVTGIDSHQQYIAKNSPSIYYYRNSFDYENSYHKMIGVNNNINGCGHADDVFHIFWWSNMNQSLDPEHQIYTHRKRMVRMWTNFAKYHNPTPLGTKDSLLNVTWTPSGTEGMALEIGQTSFTMQSRPTSNLVKKLQKYGKSTYGCSLF